MALDTERALSCELTTTVRLRLLHEIAKCGNKATTPEKFENCDGGSISRSYSSVFKKIARHSAQCIALCTVGCQGKDSRGGTHSQRPPISTSLQTFTIDKGQSGPESPPSLVRVSSRRSTAVQSPDSTASASSCSRLGRATHPTRKHSANTHTYFICASTTVWEDCSRYFGA